MTDGAVVSLDLFRRRQQRGKVVDDVIAWWPCRIPGCRERCGVTQTAIETLQLFNAEIVRRSRRADPLIESDEVMLCTEHASLIDYNRRRNA
jgi:hypothetical protein